MDLYVGGAFQGKKEYVDNKYSGIKKLKWYDGQSIEPFDITKYDAIYNYQEVVRRELLEGKVPDDEIKRLIDLKPDIIIVCNEVGCGVIPIAKEDRIFREAVGRCMCIAAAKADSVTRIICGIGQEIK